MNKSILFLGIACLLAHTAQAADPSAHDDAVTLDTVVVTATRTPEQAFNLPAPIQRIELESKHYSSIADAMRSAAGVNARDRMNYAQDTQISVRGYGARSTFGIRGIKLYTDGIPASQPDGQGQISHFVLDNAGSMEILRGPFAAMYGNASGGVIQLFTATPDTPQQLRIRMSTGSHSTHQVGLNLRGISADDFSYNISYNQFRTDGQREHSKATRHGLNSKMVLPISDMTTLNIMTNIMHQPFTQDPLGLTREQFQQNPDQVASVAKQFNTRKQVSQAQVGTVLEHTINPQHQLYWMLYGGTRDVQQFLSIPQSAQTPARHAGGVIDLGNVYAGSELRWTSRYQLMNRPFTLNLGLVYDTLRQHRTGHENFIGSQLGVTGRLRRDEIDRAENIDQYVQADWEVHDRWRLLAGIRHSRVTLAVDDRYITGNNPDDSGSVTYEDTTPTIGVLYMLTPAVHLYASAGKGFETPTLAEAGYRADGQAGLALNLQAAESDTYEIGGKWNSQRLKAELSVYQSDTKNEISVATASGGRTTYQNIGNSRRRGAEFFITTQLAQEWQAALTYTYLDARFTSAYLGCSNRCTLPDTPIAAGSRIPGIARHTAYAELTWAPSLWQLSANVTHSSDVTTNDFGTSHAPGYTLFGAEISRFWTSENNQIRTFLRVNNLADKTYVGSVIVNDGNGRYFEPGAGRNWWLGLEFLH